MTSSTISNHVTVSVTLGSGVYASPLTVTSLGFVDPGAGGFYGATALTATINGGSVVNQGTAQGGRGAGGYMANPTSTNNTGGIGIDLAGGTLSNVGMIFGGGGGYNAPDTTIAGTGGSGVVAAGGSLTNIGTIFGGLGGGGYFDYSIVGGSGGSGAAITNSSLMNGGLIAGGGGGFGNFSNNKGGPGGAAGDGVDAVDSSLANSGTINGGAGGRTAFSSVPGTGGAGGTGVDVANSIVANSGTIRGGAGDYGAGTGGAGATLTAGSTLTNTGTMQGGAGGYGGFTGYGTQGGAGGDGGDVADSSLTNTGEIIGGQGGNGESEGFGGSGGVGVSLQDGGLLTNHGEIAGGTAGEQTGLEGAFYGFGGVGVSATNSSLTNDRTITGGAGLQGGTGVNLTGSTLTNDGLIQAGAAIGVDTDEGGIGVAAANSTVANNGTITGAYGFYGGAGVEITNSRLTNTGVIAGGTGDVAGTGVDVTSSVFTNIGSIAGGNSNDPAFGKNGTGVLFHGGGTLTNAGYISGGVDAHGTADAIDFGTGSARLIVDPGAVFSGNVVAQSAFATLELASAAGIGTITGIGTSFTGFGTVTVDAQAAWTVTGSVTATDTITLGAGSDLTLTGGVDAAWPVRFAANSGTLGLGDPTGFAATVFGFQVGGAFDFTSIGSAGSITAGVDGSNDLTLTSGGSLLAQIKLDPAQSFAGDVFHAAPDGHGGTLVTATPLCFLAGTMITTPSGEIPVERLAVGGLVVTASGARRPIVWIGTGRVLATRNRRSAATPVIVRKGALADNVPYRDLAVTKAHALWLDGVLIPVEFLVNHRTILWDDMAQEVTLYHVELETHDVLLANGAPAESYRDDGNRWLFQNANTGWDQPAKAACAPVLTSGPPVDTAWLRLLDRSGSRPKVPLTGDPDLHLLVDDQRVDAVSRTGPFHVFRLAQPPAAAAVASRASVPQELGLARDPRCLGVAVGRIVIRQGTRSVVVEPSDPRLTDGFHGFEATEGFRWTDGDAVLPIALFVGFAGPLEVVLHCAATARYLEEGGERSVA